jgi:hypothetical protein
MVDNGYLLCFRWLELLAEPRKDSGQIRPVDPSNRHRHLQIWPMSWPDKLSSSINSCRLKWVISISNPEDYLDFLSTQSPLFHKADKPLDADAWLRTIESKFALLSVPCSDENKALFAAQQLRGTARLWWDHFYAMQPANHVITWDEFRTAFRAHHIPEGLIERKLNEFLNLTQGTRTVIQYAQVFNHLCQYAGYHADSDARKRDHFHRGLNTKLKERLNLVRADNFNELVNMTITQEDCISAHRAKKKRKAPTGPVTTQPSRYRLVPSNAPRAPPRGNLPGRWVARPPEQA